ncbi:protein phosphatase 2C domain-containing protein [Cytobacillus oceanisediminis]|uniref:Serine/threonine protein phosphatase PrpC n=1 Tax=Cytobacillus oceanisediminis TaxID=665099 RepID=A0A562JRM2_9BACI|nr:protein phosphatase 2C domain-containing protein [Cytobacillus oceanisediminis]TWH85840.1 serine/threonine protein phosphatase PrpC [Cytobacillus oceanisediminis]
MNNICKFHEYSWVGSKEPFLDEISILHIGRMVLGRFGGNTSAGQYKNEDGCLLWASEYHDWEFVVLLDAHTTAQSAELVIETIQSLKNEIKGFMSFSAGEAFDKIGKLLLAVFNSQNFKDSCRKVRGETAFLCTVRKGSFLWWLSVGDCILHLFHPDLFPFKEFQQNHRSFYEWIGRVNTFELPVPCYTMGTKELRKGDSLIFLTTDGLTECPNTSFSDPQEILNVLKKGKNANGVTELLKIIKEKNARDSTTIISWNVESERIGSHPGS